MIRKGRRRMIRKGEEDDKEGEEDDKEGEEDDKEGGGG